MLDDVKTYLKEDIVIGVLIFVFLFAGVFGAVNWNNHIMPQVPQRAIFEKENSYQARMSAYELECERVGKDAVISRMWAIPLCVIGLMGTAFFGMILVHRNMP